MAGKAKSGGGDDRIIVPTLVDGFELDKKTFKALCRGVVEPKKQKYLVALAQLGNRTRAARAVGISPVTAWTWRREDDNFRRQFMLAMDMAAELHEDEMLRRSSEGVLEPVFQGGHLVGSVRRFSDTLMIFGLKGMMPEKYADRQKVTHDGELTITERLRAGRERALKRKQ